MLDVCMSISHPGEKFIQLDNGANISVFDSADDLVDVSEVTPVRVKVWNGPQNEHGALTQRGFLPGLKSAIFVKAGASCILHEFDFLDSGWKMTLARLDSTDRDSTIHDAVIMTKDNNSIVFRRHPNKLLYAPYAETVAILSSMTYGVVSTLTRRQSRLAAQHLTDSTPTAAAIPDVEPTVVIPVTVQDNSNAPAIVPVVHPDPAAPQFLMRFDVGGHYCLDAQKDVRYIG